MWKVKIGKETNGHDIQSFANSEVRKVTDKLGDIMTFTDQSINATINKITHRADGIGRPEASNTRAPS